MLFQLSVGSVKGLHRKRGMCILRLQKYWQSSVISTYPPVIGGEEKKFLERFAIVMYDRSSSATDIDSVRLDMASPSDHDAIPPASAALDYHTKRAAYQAGCIWGQAITRQMEILCPSEWGVEAA